MGIAALLITSKKCSREIIVKAAKDASLIVYAVFQEKIELFIALIEAGVNINASNPKGETALHIACKKGNSVAVKILLQICHYPMLKSFYYTNILILVSKTIEDTVAEWSRCTSC